MSLAFQQGVGKTPGGGHVVVSGEGGGTVAVPGGNFLVHAEFARAGSDLLLTGPGGAKVVVVDYFRHDVPPALGSGTAVLSGDLVVKLAGPQAPGQFAQAAGSSPAAALGAPVGKFDKVEGTVTVRHADGTTSTVRSGDVVYGNDLIETKADGAAGIVFADRSTFALGKSGRMVIDEFVYDPKAQHGSSTVAVVHGAFSFISGDIAKLAPDAAKVRTPVMTIGIRGTTVAGVAGGEGEDNAVTLLPDADGNIGQLVITTGAGSSVLSSLGESVLLNSLNQAPAPVILNAVTISSMYGTVTVHLPPQPVSHPNLEPGRPVNAPPSPGNGTNGNGNGAAPGNGGGTTNADPGPHPVNGPQGDPGFLSPSPVPPVTEVTPEKFIPAVIGLVKDVGKSWEVPVDNPPGDGRNDTPAPAPAPENLTPTSLDVTMTGTYYDGSGFSVPQNITGTEGDDTIVGGAGTDTIQSQGGNDTIVASAGNDVIVGGSGGDTLSYAGKSGVVYVDLAGGTATGAGGTASVSGIENVVGGSGADTLIGSSGSNALYGDGGNDRIEGGGGADTLVGGLGSDTVVLRSGDFAAGETIDGTAESGTLDKISLSGGAFALSLGATVANIDVIEFAANAAYALAVDSAMIATADANGDGSYGDLRIGSAVTNTTGVSIGLRVGNGQSVTVDGSNLGGDDTISVSFRHAFDLRSATWMMTTNASYSDAQSTTLLADGGVSFYQHDNGSYREAGWPPSADWYFTTTASSSETLTLDWSFSGFNCWYMAHADAWVFNQTQNVRYHWDGSSSLSFGFNAGDVIGVQIQAGNFDSSSIATNTMSLFYNDTYADPTQHIDGGAGCDTLRIDGAGTLADSFLTNVSNVETLSFSALKQVTLAAHSETAGITTADGSDAFRAFSVDASARSQAITILGGAYNDTLIGGAGDDVLAGGSGNDTLTGNGGADTFVFDGGTGSAGTFDRVRALGNDLIKGFNSGTDVLKLMHDTFGLGNSGTLQDGVNYHEISAALTGTATNLGGSGAGIVVFGDGASNLQVWYSTDQANASTNNSYQIATLDGVTDLAAVSHTDFKLA